MDDVALQTWLAHGVRARDAKAHELAVLRQSICTHQRYALMQDSRGHHEAAQEELALLDAARSAYADVVAQLKRMDAASR
jgi:hypothetical protein